jgi:hypothetical protein
MADLRPHPASFKDPSGFIFERDNKLYRQVNQSYAKSYDLLMSSGLYKELTEKQLMVPHSEVTEDIGRGPDWYKTITPERISFISYPYEWCFSQLQDAAILTLTILRKSLSKGMILKDATPYNIQFKEGKPIFIDTLSFEKYDPSQPWVAYRQFCQNFLFPLYLEHYLHTDIQKIMSCYIDGIPVDITAKLLPLKSNLNLGVWLHVYLQNSVRANSKGSNTAVNFNQTKLLNLISHLESIIKGFTNRKIKSTWSNYYEETILGKEYLKEKERIFREMVDNHPASSVLDMGANDGYFSKIAAEKGRQVISTDFDSRTISNLYEQIKKSNVTNIYPIVLDISNPSPAIGFDNKERAAFTDRVKPDLVFALALIHHLVIGKNIPLEMVAAYFAKIAPELLIEFVPKSDDKVKQMLATREDVFDKYTEEHFESSFNEYFTVVRKQQVTGTDRILYMMKRKG